MRIMLGSLSGFWRISIGRDFYRNSTNISISVPQGFERSSKGFLYGFYMDFNLESLGTKWESRGFLNGFYVSFCRAAMGSPGVFQ